MQAGDLCRAARTLDHPLGLADYSENMAALDRFEGGSRQVRGRRRGAGGELGVALKVEGGAGREDDSAFQDVLQLADVPKPSIGDEASHGLPAHSVDPLADASSGTSS